MAFILWLLNTTSCPSKPNFLNRFPILSLLPSFKPSMPRKLPSTQHAVDVVALTKVTNNLHMTRPEAGYLPHQTSQQHWARLVHPPVSEPWSSWFFLPFCLLVSHLCRLILPCCRSVVSDFVTPWTAARQAFLSHLLPEFTHTHVHWVSDAIQPSHPLSPLLLPSSFTSPLNCAAPWISPRPFACFTLQQRSQTQERRGAKYGRWISEAG